MKFIYPENQKLIDHLESLGVTHKAVTVSVRATVSNLRVLANESERAAKKMAEKSGKKLLLKAVRFHERANELQQYLDERKTN